MNVHKCSNFKVFGKYCAFANLSLDKNGKVDESSATCSLRGYPHDDFRLVPEHNLLTGNLIYQRGFSSDPFPVGPNVIWESLTPHDTGLTFSFRGGNSRFREDHDMHPLYAVVPVNEPTTLGIGEKTVITPYGNDENLAFSTVSWRDQKTPGLDRIVKCYPGLYGSYNKAYGMVVPKCIKDYCGKIPHWVNYTTIPAPTGHTWTMAVVDSNPAEIVAHCIKWFGTSKLAFNIAKILLAIKNGEYIPIKAALLNCGVHWKVANQFMLETNVRSKARKESNLEKYYLYYMHLKKLPKEKSFTYRANLINYLLNDPTLETMDVNKPDSVLKDGSQVFSRGKRYWFLIMILKDILKEEKRTKLKLINNSTLPQWLFTMIDKFQEKRESEEEKPEPTAKSKTLVSIVKDLDSSYEKDRPRWNRKARIFARLAKAGILWTEPEIRATWFNFSKAFDCRNPRRFWDWLETVKMANDEQARKLMLTDIETPPERKFAHHLLEAMRSKDSFEVAEPHIYGRWMAVYPKGAQLHKEGSTTPTDPRDIFFKAYQRVNVIRGRMASVLFNKARHQLVLNNPSLAASLIDEYREESENDVLLGQTVDKEDIGVFRSGNVNVVTIDGSDAVLGRSSNSDDIDFNFDDAESGEHFDTDSAETLYENNKEDTETKNSDERGGI